MSLVPKHIKNLSPYKPGKRIEDVQKQNNLNDIIKLASTKWNFIKYKPGLVGGHCIGVDPYYLAYKSKKAGHNPRIIPIL